MKPITREEIDEMAWPKCYCKSTRGRKMKIVCNWDEPELIRFPTGALMTMHEILGWGCPNCDGWTGLPFVGKFGLVDRYFPSLKETRWLNEMR
jgi:hypothetical protein